MSKYFQLAEFLRSSKAVEINCVAEQQNPPQSVKNNIEELSVNVLDKIREKFGEELRISSGYRCPTVNTAVGGSESSQHMSAQAADFSVASSKAKNTDLMWCIIDMVNNGEITIDQLINEYPNSSGQPSWIHVSYRANGANRTQFLVYKKSGGVNIFGNDPFGNGKTSIYNNGTKTYGVGVKSSSSSSGVLTGNNVFSGASSRANTLSDGGTLQTNSSDGTFKYRIYQEFEPTIIVDELSMKPNSAFGKTPESDISYKDRPANDTEIATAGKTYPYIRINDYYFNIEEINEMTIDHYGFVPKLELSVSTWNKALIKTEVIKEGDICSIYCAEDHDSIDNQGNRSGESLIRPLRCDFRITHVFSNPISQKKLRDGLKLTIYGELNIPDLHNANLSFSYSGTSRDVLRETAKQLKLGFCFNNPNNTEDTQIWQCQPTDKQGPDTFIKDVTSHSWLEEHHFFDSWIEPRYNLCFIDVNQQLGWEGLDDGIDIASIKSTLINLQNADGTLMTPKYDAEKNNPFFAKMFHNINDNALLAHSSFKVKKYNIVNKSTAVSREIGLIRNAEQNLNNAGLYEENTIEHLEYKLAINWDKVGDPSSGKKGSFYVLDGPGSTTNYVSAEDMNGNYSTKEVSKKPEEIVDVQSSGDAETISSTGTNELASGNLAASYAVAFDHNLLNNMQLEKQYVEITCQGNNQGIMRGEKVPCFLIDYSILENATSGKNPSTQIYSHIEALASGWFIIDGIKWHYKKNLDPETNETNWETLVKLCRREWPIPKYVGEETEENNSQQTTSINTAGGSVKESVQEQSVSESSNQTGATLESTDATAGNEETSKNKTPGTVTTDGLQSYMKNLWANMENAFVDPYGTVELISAKRWFVDENGNKLEAWDGRTVDGMYEIMNSDGTIGYYENKNSMHLEGKAIDFTYKKPGDKSENYVFEFIANNPRTTEILKIMFKNNLVLQKETQSGSNVMHYDISFCDNYEKKVAWWTYVYQMRGGDSTIAGADRVDFGIYVKKD